MVQLPLCTVLLMDDKRYPWLVLVPRKVGKIHASALNGPNRHTRGCIWCYPDHIKLR